MILKSTVLNAMYNIQYVLIAVNNLSISFVCGPLSPFTLHRRVISSARGDKPGFPRGTSVGWGEACTLP